MSEKGTNSGINMKFLPFMGTSAENALLVLLHQKYDGMTDNNVTNIETKEAMRRMKEVAFAFGGTGKHDPLILSSDMRHLQNFLSYLRERESKRMKWNRKSPQLKHRRCLTSYLMQICSSERYSMETTYQALYLLDRFMDQHEINENQLGLVAAVCIVISGKLLETDSRVTRVPNYKRMIKIMQLEREIIKRLVVLESYILQAFNFDVLVPLEINFLEVYLLYAVDGHTYRQTIDSDDNNNNSATHFDANNNQADHNAIQFEEQGRTKVLLPADRLSDAGLIEKMQELSFRILEEVTKRGEPSNTFAPSLIAAAIVMATRREYGLNFWTPTLHRVTSYDIGRLSCCLKVYLEPRLTKMKFKEPFENPSLVNVTFKPYILFKDSEPL